MEGGMTINPDDPVHAALLKDVEGFLKEHGFLTASATYHDVMTSEIKNRLMYLDTPVAHYIRTRADRIAIHSTLPICFEFECKSHGRAKGHNAAIEALPLAHARLKNSLGVKTLYCYRDESGGIDCGFWSNKLPAISTLMLTPRYEGTKIERILVNFYTTGKFFGLELQESFSFSNMGSGDIFVIIDESVVRTLPSWKDLVLAEIASSQTPDHRII
jgi:hypothetical protein